MRRRSDLFQKCRRFAFQKEKESSKEMSLVQTAKAAVEADRNGNIDDAIEQYIKCVELIMKLILKSEKKDSKELKILKKRGKECTSCR